MKLEELLADLQGRTLTKNVVILYADQDPIYYDSTDTTANMVHIVCDEYGTPQGVTETDENNKVIYDSLGLHVG